MILDVRMALERFHSADVMTLKVTQGYGLDAIP